MPGLAHALAQEIRAGASRTSLIARARACARIPPRHCWHDLFPCLRPQTTLRFFQVRSRILSAGSAHFFHHTLAPVGSLDLQRAVVHKNGPAARVHAPPGLTRQPSPYWSTGLVSFSHTGPAALRRC